MYFTTEPERRQIMNDIKEMIEDLEKKVTPICEAHENDAEQLEALREMIKAI